MSINLSVIREDTDLGHFWFPSLDVAVPLRPLQVLIFQGMEDHTGMPAVAQSDSTVPIPLNYVEEFRINIICYPSRRGINSREHWRRTVRDNPEGGSGPCLYEDALPCLDDARAYQRWKCEEAARTVVILRDRLATSAASTVVVHQITRGPWLLTRLHRRRMRQASCASGRSMEG